MSLEKTHRPPTASAAKRIPPIPANRSMKENSVRIMPPLRDSFTATGDRSARQGKRAATQKDERGLSGGEVVLSSALGSDGGEPGDSHDKLATIEAAALPEIGRAPCREKGCQ